MSAALAGACRGTWRSRLSAPFTSADESQQFYARKISACLPYGAHAEIKRAGASCRRLTEGASEVVRDARPLTATALQFGRMQCSAARELSRVHPTVSFVNSLALRDRLQNQSRKRKYLSRIVVRGEQMSAAQTIALKARSQETAKTAPRGASSRRLSTRRLLLAGAAIVAVAGASDYGWYYWTTGRFEVSTDDCRCSKL